MADQAHNPKYVKGAWWYLLALVVGIFLVTRWVLGPPHQPSIAAPETKRFNESLYIVQHQERVASMLKDPRSAEWRNLRVSRRLGADVPIVCGEVNSRNSFGGMGGYQRFLSGGQMQVLEEQIGADEMSELWREAC